VTTAVAPPGGRYKWVALSNTTLGVLMSALDGSIVIIALPAIFRGIGLDPLAPGNIGYLLWMILGYLRTGGLLLVAASFLGLLALPVDFSYPAFAGLLVLSGIGQGVFSAPNTSAIMSSVPEHQRGVASGMRSTFQNSGTALSIGVFFSLMVAGLARSLPDTLTAGLAAHGVPAVTADAVATLPPVSTLFAAFLGSNPVAHLLGPDVLAGLAPADAAALTGTEFFPRLITEPFHQGLVTVFTAAAGMALVAAIASASRGRRYFHQEARPTGDTGRAPSA
jgi:MFS family permease